MSEARIKFLIMYLIAVFLAYIIKKRTYRIATKAIKEEKLSTGIYSVFPIKGKKAVELANGYIRGANIAFWFVVFFFPFGFLIAFYFRGI